MSEPVGPQYGLDPRITPVEVQPVYTSVNFLENLEDYRGGSEFGGVPGLVQPAPHVPTASERLAQIHQIDPSDPGLGEVPTSVAAPELEGNFNSEY